MRRLMTKCSMSIYTFYEFQNSQNLLNQSQLTSVFESNTPHFTIHTIHQAACSIFWKLNLWNYEHYVGLYNFSKGNGTVSFKQLGVVWLCSNFAGFSKPKYTDGTFCHQPQHLSSFRSTTGVSTVFGTGVRPFL